MVASAGRGKFIFGVAVAEVTCKYVQHLTPKMYNNPHEVSANATPKINFFHLIRSLCNKSHSPFPGERTALFRKTHSRFCGEGCVFFRKGTAVSDTSAVLLPNIALRILGSLGDEEEFVTYLEM